MSEEFSVLVFLAAFFTGSVLLVLGGSIVADIVDTWRRERIYKLHRRLK